MLKYSKVLLDSKHLQSFFCGEYPSPNKSDRENCSRRYGAISTLYDLYLIESLTNFGILLQKYLLQSQLCRIPLGQLLGKWKETGQSIHFLQSMGSLFCSVWISSSYSPTFSALIRHWKYACFVHGIDSFEGLLQLWVRWEMAWFFFLGANELWKNKKIPGFLSSKQICLFILF